MPASTWLLCCRRYDDLSSASDNIDLQTTILSRFDLIFIVRDVPDEQKDQDIAR
jgi:DNA replication licensing factor MCM5